MASERVLNKRMQQEPQILSGAQIRVQGGEMDAVIRRGAAYSWCSLHINCDNLCCEA